MGFDMMFEHKIELYGPQVVWEWGTGLANSMGTYGHAFSEEQALAEMFAEEIVFLGGVDAHICVNANDIWMWACADAVRIENHEDVMRVWQWWKLYKPWGVVRWCCVKRQMQPQKPMKDDIIKDGLWDDVFEALPLNPDARE